MADLAQAVDSLTEALELASQFASDEELNPATELAEAVRTRHGFLGESAAANQDGKHKTNCGFGHGHAPSASIRMPNSPFSVRSSLPSSALALIRVKDCRGPWMDEATSMLSSVSSPS